jgi:hypothetical protein
MLQIVAADNKRRPVSLSKHKSCNFALRVSGMQGGSARHLYTASRLPNAA